jgi:hypothetical protein
LSAAAASLWISSVGALASQRAALALHLLKLEQFASAGQFTSSALKTMRNVASLIATIEQFLLDNGL